MKLTAVCLVILHLCRTCSSLDPTKDVGNTDGVSAKSHTGINQKEVTMANELFRLTDGINDFSVLRLKRIQRIAGDLEWFPAEKAGDISSTILAYPRDDELDAFENSTEPSRAVYEFSHESSKLHNLALAASSQLFVPRRRGRGRFPRRGRKGSRRNIRRLRSRCISKCWLLIDDVFRCGMLCNHIHVAAMPAMEAIEGALLEDEMAAANVSANASSHVEETREEAAMNEVFAEVGATSDIDHHSNNNCLSKCYLLQRSWWKCQVICKNHGKKKNVGFLAAATENEDITDGDEENKERAAITEVFAPAVLRSRSNNCLSKCYLLQRSWWKCQVICKNHHNAAATGSVESNLDIAMASSLLVCARCPRFFASIVKSLDDIRVLAANHVIDLTADVKSLGQSEANVLHAFSHVTQAAVLATTAGLGAFVSLDGAGFAGPAVVEATRALRLASANLEAVLMQETSSHD